MTLGWVTIVTGIALASIAVLVARSAFEQRDRARPSLSLAFVPVTSWLRRTRLHFAEWRDQVRSAPRSKPRPRPTVAVYSARFPYRLWVIVGWVTSLVACGSLGLFEVYGIDESGYYGEENPSVVDSSSSSSPDMSGTDYGGDAEPTTLGPGAALVPDLVGMQIREALDLLADLGFTNVVAERLDWYIGPEPSDCEVFVQEPESDSILRYESRIDLYFYDVVPDDGDCE